MTRRLTFGLLLALAAGLLLRCPQLDSRPMHNDEAVNAIKLRDLWQRNTYRYDPSEYHGPTLIYAARDWVELLRVKSFVELSEAQLRSLTVLFGMGLIALLALLRNALGPRATVMAALLTAVSPAMVFYSRYFIHEMLLVFFTLLLIAAGWHYVSTRKIGWAILAGAAAGLMQATKETFVLNIAAMVLALPLVGTRRSSTPISKAPRRFNVMHLAVFLVAWLGVATVLFTSFFSNPQGLVDAVRTYLPWGHRAAGASPHIHPWNFYLERLAYFHSGRGPVWSEGLILALALVGVIAAFSRQTPNEGNRGFIRFIAAYTVLLTVIYCAIGYKTPWCLLNFLDGMILLAGVGAVALMGWLPNRAARAALVILLVAGMGQLAWQAWRTAITYAADPRNPYVYAQTSPDVLNLVERVKSVATMAKEKGDVVIKVIAPESGYWPLPWYLRQFPNVGWYAEMPADPYAPIVIVSTRFNASLDADTHHVMAGFAELRTQTFFEIYVETNLWRAHLADARPKD